MSPSQTPLRLALAQINPVLGDLKANADKIIAMAKVAAARAADVVIFPELALTGYPPEDLIFKERFVEDNLKALDRVRRSVRDVAVVVGFVDQIKQRSQRRFYNAAAVIEAGRLRGVHHKTALPNYGVFDEKRYFQEGKKPTVLFQTRGVCWAVNICEDIWVEGGIVHDQAEKGAQVLINISSSPYDYGKLSRRRDLLFRRARETQSLIVYVNLVGGQDELVFDGGSMVVSATGRLLATAEPFREDLLMFDVEPSSLISKPRISNRRSIVHIKGGKTRARPTVHVHLAREREPIERVYDALVLGTRDYVFKNGFNKVVIGLSGGVDSSVTACLATAALGRDRVVGVSMPSEFTSRGTRRDAARLAANLGISFYEIPITSVFRVYQKILRTAFDQTSFDITEENLQARIRGNILMAFSNKFGWLVLATGNKSELATGYCTLYGDMVGGFAVIKDVPKTMVYELARWINAHHNAPIPDSILERAPSAELRPNQKDQDTLPPYEILDAIIQHYVEEHKSVRVLERRFGKDLTRAVIERIDRSEYKRRQAPLGIKITPRAFGKDWRLPVTQRYREGRV